MRSFSLIELDADAFDAFSAKHPQGNFQQTSRMGTARVMQGVQVEYLGVAEDGELIAAAQLEIHKGSLSTFAEIHDGPLMDLSDRELVDFFFSQMKRRSREAGAAQLQVTPEAPYLLRDAEGRPLPDSRPADAAVENLKGVGFRHAGFDVGYTAVPRWRFIKDLAGISSEKDLLSSYEKKTLRNNVRIAQSSGVQVERASREDLAVFHGICELSCEKQGFENHELGYFELLHDALGDMAEFNIAYIDFRAYLVSWERKRDEFLEQIAHIEELREASPNSKKLARQLDDVHTKLGGAEKRIAEARRYIESDGERVPAAAAMFVWHERECIYLFSGSNQRYARFYPAIAIQHHMMMKCIERGCDRYNFYGISGIFDDEDHPTRGLLEFKQGFGGYVEELMGEFVLPVKPITFAAKRFAHRLLGR